MDCYNTYVSNHIAFLQHIITLNPYLTSWHLDRLRCALSKFHDIYQYGAVSTFCEAVSRSVNAGLPSACVDPSVVSRIHNAAIQLSPEWLCFDSLRWQDYLSTDHHDDPFLSAAVVLVPPVQTCFDCRGNRMLVHSRPSHVDLISRNMSKQKAVLFRSVCPNCKRSYDTERKNGLEPASPPVYHYSFCQRGATRTYHPEALTLPYLQVTKSTIITHGCPSACILEYVRRAGVCGNEAYRSMEHLLLFRIESEHSAKTIFYWDMNERRKRYLNGVDKV